MSLRHLGAVDSTDHLPTAQGGSVGHDHFWDRALSRRRFFGSAAAAAGAVVAGSALRPLTAWAGGADPKPIPGGIVAGGQGWHVFVPEEGAEPSTIFDFTGAVASHVVRGTGMGRQGGVEVPFVFETDVRFMRGKYIGLDKRLHTGTFGFI